MSIEEKLESHLENFNGSLPTEGFTIIAISAEGQVLGQLGSKRDTKELHSLGALLAGVWQASEALNSFLESSDEEDLKLSYNNSSSGYFVLPPNDSNPKILWGFLFENQVNPGKVKYLASKVREHFNEVQILMSNESAEEDFLFKNVTNEEVDDLFSFAGI